VCEFVLGLGPSASCAVLCRLAQATQPTFCYAYPVFTGTVVEALSLNGHPTNYVFYYCLRRRCPACACSQCLLRDHSETFKVKQPKDVPQHSCIREFIDLLSS
jgi:hypothetical protein